MKRISTHEYRSLLTRDYKIVGLFSFICFDWFNKYVFKIFSITLQSGSSIREELSN